MITEKEFESVQEAAERLGVTVRAIQKWAAAGKLEGAEKLGRTWFIPKNSVPVKNGDTPVQNSLADVYQLYPFRSAMPLLNSSYPVGKCTEFISKIDNEDDRNIALSEYYFFSGRSEEATQILEPYIDSHDPSLRFSSNLIYAFANLSGDRLHLTRFAMSNLYKQVDLGMKSNAPDSLHAIGVFTATAAAVLLHLPVTGIPPLEKYLRYLPGGLKLWASYLLAHKAYLEGNYERALAIADLSLSAFYDSFPIAEIYVHIIAAIALINLKRTDEAKNHIELAWKIAEPDSILQPFAEHHGLLQGLIEVYFKKSYPKVFEKIIQLTYAFSSGWRKIHNPETEHDVADNLTTTEFTVAMLYNRGWSAQEIAVHMEISEHTVRSYIKTIYIKLGISDRNGLRRFMLK